MDGDQDFSAMADDVEDGGVSETDLPEGVGENDGEEDGDDTDDEDES